MGYRFSSERHLARAIFAIFLALGGFGCSSSSSPADAGVTIDAASPSTLPDGGAPDHQAAALSAGRLHTCGLSASGGMECWGDNTWGELGLTFSPPTSTSTPAALVVPTLATGVTAIAVGNEHSCALTSANDVLCWGSNARGQLGLKSVTSTPTPTRVSGLSAPSAIAAGAFHTCVISSGGVSCWGAGTNGQLGNLMMVDSPTPVAVSGLASGVTAVVAGGAHTCALTNGGVSCWGYNTYGQLGNGSNADSAAPVTVMGLGSNVTALSAGTAHTCAVAGGAVLCWGYGQYGQLGNGTTNSSSVPVMVLGLGTTAHAVAAGGTHACAIGSGGAVFCWGDDQSGQLGDGGAIDQSTPVAVMGIGSGATAIVGGTAHTCAILGGAIQCWGWNVTGQLGNDTMMDSPTPVEVATF